MTNTADGIRTRRRRRRFAAAGWLAVIVMLVTAGAVFVSGTAWAGERVLLLGVDSRTGDKGRSDAIVIMSPQPLGRGLTMLSVPRDSRVPVPGRGTTKINHAFAYGGADLSLATAEQFLNLPLEHHITFNFKAVEEIVDALGGITLEIESPMNYHDPYQNLLIDLEPGVKHLNGEEALGFLRFRRDSRGDIGRGDRHRQFIEVFIKTALKPSSWPRLPAVYKAFTENVQTSMTPFQLIRFSAASALALMRGIDSQSVPGRSATIDGVSYWIPDEEALVLQVDELFNP